VFEDGICPSLVAEIGEGTGFVLDHALRIVLAITACGGDDELACLLQAAVIECILGQRRFFDVTMQPNPDADTFALCCDILAFFARRHSPEIYERFREAQFIEKIVSVLSGGFNLGRSIIPGTVLGIIEGSNRQLLSEFVANDGLLALVDLLDPSLPEVASQIVEILAGFHALLPEADVYLADATVVAALNRVLDGSTDDALLTKCDQILQILGGV
jgi:hypothetical protein